MTKPTYDDSDLERVLRDALRHHAGDAPERLDAPVAGTPSAAAIDTERDFRSASLGASGRGRDGRARRPGGTGCAQCA
jgi:hypothetical protein